MGRTKKENLLPSELVPPEDFDFQDFLNEIGATAAMVDVHQMLPNGSRAYRTRWDMNEFKDGGMEMLQTQLGPGKYWLVFKGSDYGARRSKVVVVGPKTGDYSGSGAYSALTPHGAPTPNPLSGNATVTEWQSQMYRDQQQFQQTLLAGLIAAMKPPDLTPLVQVMKTPDIAGLFTAIVTAFVQLKGNGDETEKLKTYIGVVRSLLPETSGGSSKEDNVYSVIKEVGNRFVDKLGQMGPPIQQLPVPPPLPQLPPLPQPELQPQPQPQPLTLMDALKAQLHYLKAKARQARDVEDWIDYILDNQDEAGCQAILGAMRQGATVQTLLGFDSEIGQDPRLVSWFTALYDGLYAELSQPSMDTPGTRRDVDHVTNDAGRGAPLQPEHGSADVGSVAGKPPQP